VDAHAAEIRPMPPAEHLRTERSLPVANTWTMSHTRSSDATPRRIDPADTGSDLTSGPYAIMTGPDCWKGAAR
jgi:hypothetical protein